MKVVTRKLSEVTIKFYDTEDGKEIPFSGNTPNDRKSYMFELFTEGINVLQVRSFKLSEFSYSDKREPTVEITYEEYDESIKLGKEEF